MVAQLRANERERERRPDDRHVELAQQIGNAADVIFVAVRYEHRTKLVDAFADVREVVDDDVDAEHLVVGKHQPAVDRDQIVGRLDDRHVAPDLAATAERNDAHVRLGGGFGRDVVAGRIASPPRRLQQGA